MLTNFEAWVDRRQAPPRPVLTELKVVLRLPPTVVTAVMITTEMRAAISPYSIAVAPDSFRRNFFNICIDLPWHSIMETLQMIIQIEREFAARFTN